MLNNKRDKFLLLVAVFTFILFTGSYLIDKIVEDKKEYYLSVQSELLAVKYKSIHRYLKIMSQDIHLMYSQNQQLIDALKLAKDAKSKEEQAEIREKIYNLLKRNYKRLKHMGISSVHFHTVDNHSFLRMNYPTEYGENLTSSRISIENTNRTHEPQSGFETSRFMTGLRFVYPLETKDKEPLGSVEISFSTAYLLNSIIDDFVYDAHVLIGKNISEGSIVAEGLFDEYQKSWESENYYIEESTHKKINDKQLYKKISTPKLKKEIAEGIKKRKPFSVVVTYNYKNIILTFLPLTGTDKTKNIAYIVTYTESDYLSNIEIEHGYLKILFYTVLLMLFLFSIYVILNREKLKNLALYDPLTKLPNRALFTIEFQNELNRASRYNNKVALMFLDLDGFKAVNDTYGHQTGDALLQKVAETLITSIRKSDIACRLSGDEFTIILPDIRNQDEAVKVANFIINELNQDIIINHEVIKIGVSVGISIYPDHADNTNDLIKFADNMMYRSKINGKNQVTVYSREEEK